MKETTLALAEAAALTGDKIRAVSLLLSSYEPQGRNSRSARLLTLLRHRISERFIPAPGMK